MTSWKPSVYDAAGSKASQLYIEELAKREPLSRHEEIGLARRIQKGDLEARDKLAKANLRFVVKVARDYVKTGVSLSDLIGAGNVGLIRAAERYDPARGTKFITYAVWWIRLEIMKAIAELSRVVSLPESTVRMSKRIREYEEVQMQKKGQAPAAAEVARALDVSAEEVAQAALDSQQVLSLDRPVGFRTDGSVHLDSVADSSNEGTDSKMIRESVKCEIREALQSLEQRERKIVTLYYGLADDRPRTLGEIASQFSLTRERIRQIKKKALEKLRHPVRARRLRPYAIVD